jgi:hypothetical protein
MTAVEWLRKELQTIPDYSVFYTRNYQWIDCIMNEAQEMEKQQIEDAHISGFYSPPFGKSRNGEAKQYYNETYGTDK